MDTDGSSSAISIDQKRLVKILARIWWNNDEINDYLRLLYAWGRLTTAGGLISASSVGQIVDSFELPEANVCKS